MARIVEKPNEWYDKEKVTYTKRKCLNCRLEFDSWGIGNRICNKCKNSEVYKSYQNTTTVRFR
jgi:hypothetical protein